MEQQTDKNDFTNKVSQLPANVFAWASSDEATKNNIEIAKKFSLKPGQDTIFAKITGYIIIKKIPLEKLYEALEKNLVVNKEIARQITIDVTIKQFLPIRDYLTGAENYIKSIGGQLPDPLPPIIKAAIVEKKEEAHPQQMVSATSPLPEIAIKRNIMSAITEKEEIADQTITEKPIQFADSENLRMPTIKNWLIDYKKYRSSFPNQERALIRAKYIIDTPNAKNLNVQEKIIVSELIKSYDEHTLLPFSQKTGRLMTELIIPKQQEPTPAIPQKIVSQPPGFPPSLPNKDTFREQVADEDLAGPQAAKRPAPKLNGNIVDLKEYNR